VRAQKNGRIKDSFHAPTILLPYPRLHSILRFLRPFRFLRPILPFQIASLKRAKISEHQL